jgi:uncharacterized protein
MSPETPNNSAIETDDLVVLLLGSEGTAPPGRIDGVTRLEKLIFLLERETPVGQWLTERPDFRSHRFGPFSSKIYQAVETLAAAGLIRDSADPGRDPQDAWETVNFVLDDIDTDPFANRVFELTDRGWNYFRAVLRDLPAEAPQVISEFKRRFAVIPLRQLVRYVYERYPEFTDKSEIRRDILGHD